MSVFLIGAGIITWNLTKTVDEDVTVGGVQTDVLSIVAGQHDTTELVTTDIDETETLKHEVTYRYDVKKLDVETDYYLEVSLETGGDKLEIVTATAMNYQLSNTAEEVTVTLKLKDGLEHTPGQMSFSFLFEAVEGVFSTPAAEGETGTTLTEDFTNAPTDSSTSYIERTWTGVDGISFIATDARTSLVDHDINGGGIMLDGREPTAALTWTMPNGIQSLEFQAKVAFSDTSERTIEVSIDGTIVETFTFTPADGIQTFEVTGIDTEASTNIALSIGGAQVTVANLILTE